MHVRQGDQPWYPEDTIESFVGHSSMGFLCPPAETKLNNSSKFVKVTSLWNRVWHTHRHWHWHWHWHRIDTNVDRDGPEGSQQQKVFTHCSGKMLAGFCWSSKPSSYHRIKSWTITNIHKQLPGSFVNFRAGQCKAARDDSLARRMDEVPAASWVAQPPPVFFFSLAPYLCYPVPRCYSDPTPRLGWTFPEFLDLFIKGPASIILVPTLPSKANAAIFHSRDLFFLNHHPARVFCFQK